MTSVRCRMSISDGTILQLHSKSDLGRRHQWRKEALEFASVPVSKFSQNLPERPQDCRSVMGPSFNCTAKEALEFASVPVSKFSQNLPERPQVQCRLSISDGTILQLHSKNAQEFAVVLVLKFSQNLRKDLSTMQNVDQ
ncbi:hypothetical protein HELRODRAFT_167485 [Helobdella robusta]|uniref:Uncharacterized protein n=1 Tax=Helobdella robusta TaxID=6412 RepID=T1EZF2_HELRO|nr:hypothetical protein HELRODRAFT_167485 [Helobdella robusta]ESO10969.1 hypothetical protein HELRODRAFT_167485 [Helobdella robusta]